MSGGRRAPAVSDNRARPRRIGALACLTALVGALPIGVEPSAAAPAPAAAQPAGTPAVVQHAGFTSVFAVDSGSGRLQHSYRGPGRPAWVSEDLTAWYGLPPITGTPAALEHDGWVSAFTVDAASGHLRETFLARMGERWLTQDFHNVHGIPPVTGSPAAVKHGPWTSVFTVNAGTGHLQESYLAAGGSWATHNLSTRFTVPAASGTPVAVEHGPWTSVFTINAGTGHLQETFLNPDGVWTTQDLSAKYGTPAATGTPAVVWHDGSLRVFTVNAADRHLTETHLGPNGLPWVTQDLTARHGTPVTSGSPAVAARDRMVNVFTVNAADGHPQRTHLAPNTTWKTEDLSARYGAAAAGGSPAATTQTNYTGVFTVVRSTGELQETYESAGTWSTRTIGAPGAGCTAGTDHDYNGDGARDTAIADPEAAANGATGAGLVRVVYGSGKPVQTITVNSIGVLPGPAAGDRFGHALATYDANRDGCGDLLVGAPYRDANGVADAGAAYLILGAPGGLDSGPVSVTWRQGLVGFPGDGVETGDAFGLSLAAGQTATGEGWALVGVPGEDVGGLVDAGLAHYLRGGISTAVWYGSGVPGDAPTQDRFGYAVAGNEHHLVVSAPARTVTGSPFAGVAYIYTHQIIDGRPRLLGGTHQGNSGEQAEPNDNFGKSLAVVAYRPTGAAAGQPDSLLVVGVPGEDIGTVADAGLVHQYRLLADGAIPLGTVHENTPGVGGQAEDGDYFGERVRVVNTQPGREVTPTSVLVAVGSPGEDIGTAADAGAVRVFGATNPIMVAAAVDRGAGRLPGQPGGQELLGFSLGNSAEHLQVGSPYGEGAVYSISWADLASGRATVAATIKPGSAGIPAGEAAFGAAIG